MTEIPKHFPFTKLKLREHEIPMWFGYNPTFHRFFQYGLVISDAALYIGSGAWLFAKWKRYPLKEVSDVTLDEDGPAIKFRVGDRQVTFYAPQDFHRDETDFDRSVFSNAVAFLQSARV